MRERLVFAALLALTAPRVALADPPADESAPPAMPRVSFAEAVSRALASHPTIASARAQVRRAEALVAQARGALLPSVAVTALYTRLDDDRVLSGRVIAGADQLSANAQVSVPLVNLRGWTAMRRADLGVDVARATVDDARRAVAVATARAYLAVSSQHRIAATTERAPANATAHRDFALARFEGGIGNRVDVVRASQEVASLRSTLATQRATLARMQESLGVLLGADAPIDAVEDIDTPTLPPLERALADARSRSDVRASAARADVADRAARDLWVEYAPTLAAVFQPFYQNPATLTQPLTGWQAQAVFSWVLFDGGARYGLTRERQALRDDAAAQLEAALRQARSEVRSAFAAIRETDAAAVASHEASHLADEAMDLADTAYRAGATSNLELIDAQRRARDARAAANSADDNAREARLNLLIAAGRFP